MQHLFSNTVIHGLAVCETELILEAHRSLWVSCCLHAQRPPPPAQTGCICFAVVTWPSGLPTGVFSPPTNTDQIQSLFWERVWRVLIKLDVLVPSDLAIALLSTCPNEKTNVHIKKKKSTHESLQPCIHHYQQLEATKTFLVNGFI